MVTRIGPKMAQAVAYVSRRGGVNVPNHDVCNAVNPSPEPRKCESHGYNVVNRAVRAGLLVRSPAPNGRGAVLSLPTPAGSISSSPSTESEAS